MGGWGGGVMVEVVEVVKELVEAVNELVEVVKQVVEAVKEVQQELSGNGCSSHPPCALTLNYPLFIH